WGGARPLGPDRGGGAGGRALHAAPRNRRAQRRRNRPLPRLRLSRPRRLRRLRGERHQHVHGEGVGVSGVSGARKKAAIRRYGTLLVHRRGALRTWLQISTESRAV